MGLLIALFCLLASVLVSGCTPDEPPLRLGTNLWPGYEPLYLARDRGYLDKRKVRLVELLSTSEVLRAFRNGALDVAALTLDEALLLSDSDVPISVLLVADSSNGADVILARNAVDMAGLVGKRIGVETSALGAYMLSRALTLNHLRADQVRIVPLEASQHEQAFTSGQVDAVVTFDPVRSHLLALGAHPVFDSSEIPNEIVDVLVVRRQFAAQHADQLRNIVNGWYRALDFMHRQPAQAMASMAPRIDLTPAQLRSSLTGLDIPGRAADWQLLYGKGQPLVQQARRLNSVMLDRQLIRSRVDLDHFIVSPELYE